MGALKEAIPRFDSDRTTADLRFCGEQFESIRNDVKDLMSGLTLPQIAWQPNDATWSIAQCIEHLSVASEHDLRRLRTLLALASATTLARRGPLRASGESTSIPVVSLHDSPRVTFAAGNGRVLPPSVDAASVSERFLAVNDRMLGVVADAGDLAVAIAHENGGAVLLDMVGHTLQLSALHHWRFILQARRVTEFPGFPRR